MANTFKEHPIFWILSAVVAAFGMGIYAYRMVRQIALESVTPPPAAAGMVTASPASQTQAEVNAATRHAFENGVMGWMARDAKDVRGCQRVASSSNVHHTGGRSLEMSLAVSGGDPLRRKGEAWTEISDRDISGKPRPVDLHAATITAWVFAPIGDAYGPIDHPNGVQLFVKDAKFRSLYSQWTHLKVDDWLLLELPVSTSNPGYVDAGFDPTQIIEVGVKFEIGGGSAASYKGPIYVDDVTW